MPEIRGRGELPINFTVRTIAREEFIDITTRVAEQALSTGVPDGAVLVYCPHTTAAVTINEDADPDVLRDLTSGLARIAPRDAGWRHREGNSDGHLKSSLVGPSLLVPLENGRLVLGTWQGVYLCEFDGPRTRTVEVTVLPGVR
jgi:secondary thiamine-phosphate synthase enzyme